MKKIALIFALIVTAVSVCSCTGSAYLPDQPDGFSFALTWNCYGVSSYDSHTGELIKTTDATNPDDYVTVCHLTEDELNMVYELIRELNIASYPDEYDPHGFGITSNPPMTLILTVRTDTFNKTVAAEDIAIGYTSGSIKGQKFLTACRSIIDILTGTDEWQALPEYEFFYD